jgi:hypothetical protein
MPTKKSLHQLVSRAGKKLPHGYEIAARKKRAKKTKRVKSTRRKR